jgi:uncharacterized phiE125 gp8 family phage protein
MTGAFIQAPFWSRNLPVRAPHVSVRFVAAVTPPPEPITVADAVDFLRVSTADENTLIGRYCQAARLFVQNRIQRSLVPQTVDIGLDQAPTGAWLDLPFPPLVSVTSIAAIDVSGSSSLLDLSTFLVDTASEPGRIGVPAGHWWPMNLRTFQSLTLRIVVGYTTVPEDLVQAMRLLIGHYYENRGAIETGRIVPFQPFGVEELIAPYELVSVA